MTTKTYYDVLGVSPTATGDEIKRAWRASCAKAHPDREGGSKEAQQRINEAYEVLSDPEKRAAYDSGTEHFDLDATARNRMVMMFDAYLNDQNADHRGDLIVRFVGVVNSSIRQLEEMKRQAQRAVKRLTRQRLRIKGGDTIFTDLADTKIEEQKKRETDLDREIKVSKRLIEMLNGYTDTAPPADTADVTWGSGWKSLTNSDL